MHTNNACITSFTETSSNTTCLKKQMFFLEIKEECFFLDINYLRKEQNKTNQSTSTKRKCTLIYKQSNTPKNKYVLKSNLKAMLFEGRVLLSSTWVVI